MGVNGTRNAFLEEIYSLVEHKEDIVLVSADLAAPSLDKFRKDFPHRYISIGIAEQNLISVSCGLALSGKKVIAYAANPFPVLRAFDQIRNAVALMNLPICIVGVGAGFSIPEYGATHYTIDDINIIKTCPNIRIINVSDLSIAKRSASEIIKSENPCYIRFDRLVEGKIYKIEDVDFNRGFGVLKKGNQVAIISTGSMTGKLMNEIKYFEDNGIDVKLIDLYSIPINEDKLINEIAEMNAIAVVEELVLQGGIGSMILELLSDFQLSIPVKRIGINLKTGYPDIYGNLDYFLERYHLDIKSVEAELIKFFRKQLNIKH